MQVRRVTPIPPRPPLTSSRVRPEIRRDDRDGPRINGSILASEVRLVGANGEMYGVVSREHALHEAETAGLDLVEVAPLAKPPVCKLIDYGKFRYETQKKAAEARKKQKTVDLKEVKLRPMIDDHDLGVKLRSARAFLEEGNKVKFTLRFRGREMSHQDIARALLNRVRTTLDDVGKIDAEPSFEGRQIVMLMSAKA